MHANAVLLVAALTATHYVAAWVSYRYCHRSLFHFLLHGHSVTCRLSSLVLDKLEGMCGAYVVSWAANILGHFAP